MSAVNWDNLHRALSEPFAPDQIKQRPGRGGKSYSYIDARDVENRLDTVVGPEHWTDDYALFDPSEKSVLCRLTVFGVTKSGIGYPNSDNDEEPEKAAESDALKRAAVKFGVGRHLYSDAKAAGTPRRDPSATHDLRQNPTAPPKANPNKPPSDAQINAIKKMADKLGIPAPSPASSAAASDMIVDLGNQINQRRTDANA